MDRKKTFLSLTARCLLFGSLANLPAAGAEAAFANFEGAQTNPIRLSPDGTRLFAVNTPAKTVSVFDLTQPDSPYLIAEIPVGVEPVSVNPRNADEAWVVNQVSDSVSIVSVSRGIVTDTLSVKDEPADVVFAKALAFVSASRSNKVVAFDAASHAVVANLPLVGANPRALAVSPGEERVYVALALSGNGTTLLNDKLAPPPPPPENANLPPPPQVGLIVRADDPTWSSQLQLTMPDNDVAVIRVDNPPTVSGYYPGVGTINLGLSVNPVTGDIFVANTDARNIVRFEPNVRGHIVDNRITRIRITDGQVTPFDLNKNLNYSILPNPLAVALALAQPTAVVFDPGGLFMYVAAFGTDRVALVDIRGRVLARIEVALPSGAGALVDPRNKRGPRGLALNDSQQRLYVLNRISNTISVIDTAQQRLVTEVPVGLDPTPAAIRAGRGFLYDAKLSGNGTAACAACHVDADMDHLAWDLGDPGGELSTTTSGGQTITFHPMKGPMMTQTLRGLAGMEPFHWRGDRADFAAFNPAFDSLMGGTSLSAADMTAYSDFINSILFQPNPYQRLDRGFQARLLGGNPAAGQDTFMNAPLAIPLTHPEGVTCNSCHQLPNGSNGIIDGVDFPQPLKPPHLRNVYQKLLFDAVSESIDGFGLNHDGRLTGLTNFFKGPAFTQYSPQQAADIVAFVLSLDTGTAPAVGYTRTLNAANVDSQANQSAWSLLEAQASVGNIDLIARGTLLGFVRGLKYRPATKDYVADRLALGPYTRAQLAAFIRSGDTLSIMGVYPGTGTATKR